LKDASAARDLWRPGGQWRYYCYDQKRKEGKAAVTYDAYVGTGQPWKKLDVLQQKPVYRSNPS